MKKNFLVLLIYLTLTSTSQKLYTCVKLGYSESLASSNITTHYFINSNVIEESIVKGSFGRGANVTVDLGYNLKEHLALELSINGFKGLKYKGLASKDLLTFYKTEIEAAMLRLAPAIKFNILSKSNWQPFVRFGAVIRLFGAIKSRTLYEDNSSGISTETVLRQNKGLSLGVITALGFTKQLSPRFKFVTELSVIAQSWAPTNADVISYKVNGVDQYESLKSSQKHIHYLKKTNNSNYSAYKPMEQLRHYHPFSSIGINIGINYTFGKNIAQVKD